MSSVLLGSSGIKLEISNKTNHRNYTTARTGHYVFVYLLSSPTRVF